jgi:hypothetical protein
LRASNNARATLATDIDSSVLALTLTGDLSQFEQSGALTIDFAAPSLRTATSSEIAYYNGISGQVLTLTARGCDGTTAKSFASGSAVECRTIARHHNILAEAVIALEAESYAHQSEIDSKADIAALDDRVLKAGDTMLGELILPGAPSTALAAATKAYVDSLREPGIYRPESYGASGSAVTTSGNITSGSNQLTVASASTFAAGQGIRVVGAGASGAWLITSITSIAGNILTLATTASTPVSGALVTHDDTVAIQTALTAAWNDGAGTVKFASPSFYRCNGPIQVATNSILSIPDTGDFYTSKPRTIRLLGNDWNVGAPFGLAPTLGCIIQTDRAGTTNESSLFAAKLWDPNLPFNFGVTNQTAIVMTGLTWRTHDNPSISCVDLGMAYNAIVRECCFDTGTSLIGNGVVSGSIPGPSEPTHNTFGLRLPRFGTLIQTDCVTVAGYATNILAGDIWTSVSTYSVVGKIAVYVYSQYSHNPIYGRLFVIQCARGIHFQGESGIDMHICFEVDPRTSPPPYPMWWHSLENEFLYDPTNSAYGQVRYVRVHGYVTSLGTDITVTGTTRIIKTKLW